MGSCQVGRRGRKLRVRVGFRVSSRQFSPLHPQGHRILILQLRSIVFFGPFRCLMWWSPQLMELMLINIRGASSTCQTGFQAAALYSKPVGGVARLPLTPSLLPSFQQVTAERLKPESVEIPHRKCSRTPMCPSRRHARPVRGPGGHQVRPRRELRKNQF